MGKKKPAKGKLVPARPAPLALPSDLLGAVRTLIEQAREATARAGPAMGSTWSFSTVSAIARGTPARPR